MTTSAPITCTTAWTLVYDGTEDGEFDGSIQCNGLAVMRVAADEPTDDLTGYGSHDYPTPLKILADEKLYVRAYLGTVTVLLG